MGGGPPDFPLDFSCPVVLWMQNLYTLSFDYRTVTFFGEAFQPSSSTICISFVLSVTPPDISGLGSFPFARRYLENRVFFLLLRVLRCFSSPWCSSSYLWIQYEVLEVCSSGFPHSDISGSMSICDSPKHFGAYPVLHRLLVPSIRPMLLIT